MSCTYELVWCKIYQPYEVHCTSNRSYTGLKILTRYALKEFFPPFFLALLCFTSILLLDEIFRLTKRFVEKGINPGYLIELLIYILPVTLILTIPIATLVGILIALGRLSTDNEIAAMKSHGIGFHQILLPLLVVASLISVFDFVFMDYALPRGYVASASLKRDINMQNPAFVLEEGIIMKELEREGKLWMYESTSPDTKRLQDVKLWDSIWSGQPRFIHATAGEIDVENGQAWLKLYDGVTYEPVPNAPHGFRLTSFAEHRIALDLSETLERTQYESESPLSMSIANLKAHMTKLESRIAQANKSAVLMGRLRRAQVEYQKRFSIPFACVVFGLIGVPLGLIVKRSGKMVGTGIGLMLILVYYLILQFGQDAGLGGTLSPGLSIWLPNIAIGAIGLGFIAITILEGKLAAWRNRGEIPTFVLNKSEIHQLGESD